MQMFPSATEGAQVLFRSPRWTRTRAMPGTEPHVRGRRRRTSSKPWQENALMSVKKGSEGHTERESIGKAGEGWKQQHPRRGADGRALARRFSVGENGRSGASSLLLLRSEQK
jgi:hypothetical protein